MTWSVIVHGSYWAGCADDASDVDVMIVTEHPWPREMARLLLLDVLEGVPIEMPLDVCVTSLAELHSHVMYRAVVQYGRLVEGDPVDVQPVTAAEWAAEMRWQAGQSDTIGAGTQILSLLRAWWADDGRIVLPKSAVPAAAVGSPYEVLAAHAWAARKDPSVTLEELLTAACVTPDETASTALGSACHPVYQPPTPTGGLMSRRSPIR